MNNITIIRKLYGKDKSKFTIRTPNDQSMDMNWKCIQLSLALEDEDKLKRVYRLLVDLITDETDPNLTD
jgi:hypothetical protein